MKKGMRVSLVVLLVAALAAGCSTKPQTNGGQTDAVDTSMEIVSVEESEMSETTMSETTVPEGTTVMSEETIVMPETVDQETADSDQSDSDQPESETTDSDQLGSEQSDSDFIADARVSYLGPAGTYTEEATQLFFPEAGSLMPKATVDEAIEDVVTGAADYAVIPQENTIGGAVTNYVDALIAQGEVYVVGEVVLPISQTLMGVPGATLEDIKTVCSHVQGIAQSAEWRKEFLPDAVTEEMASTAAAASYVAETGDKTIAAVAAPGAAKLYGLEVLAENVQITDANKTRFYVLSAAPLEGLKTNAAFVASCEASRIDDIIVEIHEAGLELVAIHDRPEGSFLGSYYYIIEVEHEDGVTAESVEQICANPEIRFLGCFDIVEK